jgi:nicotinate-nucleotide adenylyltransferase
MTDLALQNHEPWRRLGIMGGTFDPIHHGHLVVAEEARDRFQLDRVVFVPNGEPPHKKPYAVSDREHRFNMCVLATGGNPFFAVSREEIDRPGVSYSVDTLRAFRDHLGPDVEMLFITGADAVLEIMTWYQPDAILQQCHIVAAHRTGFDLSRLGQALGPDRSARIKALAIPAMDVSSTDLRQRVAEGRSIGYLTPDPVVDYINKMGLYREADIDEAPKQSDGAHAHR